MPGDLIIDADLKPAVTWRGRTAAGVRVVLKKLPDDCLRRGDLHPAVRLRLARWRELPVHGVATLIGVTRHAGVVVTVSEYAPGRPLDAVPLDARAKYLPECRRIVDALHRHGLVHGAIGPGNVIVTRRGDVRLIDPSPHLYDDPQVDLNDLTRLDPAEPQDDALHHNALSASPRWHRPSLVAAAALSVVAAGAAAWWASHATDILPAVPP